MSGINLAPDHAVELTELLEFLNGWLHQRPRPPQRIPAPLRRPPRLRHQPAQSRPRPIRLPPRRRRRRQPLPTTHPVEINLTRITCIMPRLAHLIDGETSVFVHVAGACIGHTVP